MAKTSVIIPTFNRASYLSFTLAGFLLQTDQDFELILIDDGSSDTTTAIVDYYSNKLPLKYYFQEHAGLSSARNKALNIANGKYIINIDSDRIPSPVFIEEHIKKLEFNKNVVSIGFKPLILSIYNENLDVSYSELLEVFRKNPFFMEKALQKDTFALFTLEEMKSDFYRVMQRFHIRDTFDNYKEVTNQFSEDLVGFNMGWVMATGGNFSYNREGAEDIRFDEQYKGWGVEDTDFAYQLYLSGYSFVFNSKAANYHQAHPRGTNESKELKDNFNYFCNKFNSPEVYLFSRMFSDDINLIEANEILNSLNTNFNNVLIKDYLKLLKMGLHSII